MPSKTTAAYGGPANRRFSIVKLRVASPAWGEPQTELDGRIAEQRRLDAAVMPGLWVIVDEQTGRIGHIQRCLGKTMEEQIHELGQAFLKRCLLTPLLTDNGSAIRAGGRGSDGDV